MSIGQMIYPDHDTLPFYINNCSSGRIAAFFVFKINSPYLLR